MNGLWKGNVLAPFPSVVIYGLLYAYLILKYLVLCVFLKSILKCLSVEICFMITLVSFLKSVDKVFFENVFEMFLCRSKKFVLSIASRSYLLILEKVHSFPLILQIVLSYY